MQIVIDWTNQNSGFVSLLLFIITIIFGWISGIFRFLIHKPNFKIKINGYPTFLSCFHSVNKSHESEAHRIAVVTYLSITNIGSAPAEIVSVSLGYHNYSFKYTYLWFWLNITPVVGDFGHNIGKNIRLFPFLFQRSSLTFHSAPTYLQPGQISTGIAYFEQPESWGNFKPRLKNGKVKIKILVIDTFGKRYTKKFNIDVVDLDYAKKFNSNFGNTLSLIQENPLEEW
jgi:hypothetical protein